MKGKKKQATLADVGKMAGVSPSVAGTILNNCKGNSRVSLETEKRIHYAAAKLNYRPHLGALYLRGKRTQTYGLLLDGAANLVYAALAEHLHEEAATAGCQVLPVYTGVDETKGNTRLRESTDNFAYRGVDGVLCAIDPVTFKPDYAPILERFPATVFYGNPGIDGATFLEVDAEEALRTVVKHLVERRRERIGFMYLNDEPKHPAFIKGYRDELESQGLNFDKSLLFDIGLRHSEDESVNLAIDTLIVEHQADAVATHSDFWACMLMKGLARRGIKVPDDVAVTGYHNSYSTNLVDPSLTSLDMQDRRAAKEMVRLLEKTIKTGQLPKKERVVKISPQLIVRESSTQVSATTFVRPFVDLSTETQVFQVD